MGREIKRVPVGFDWPLGKTWIGFLNPFRKKFCKKCPSCDGSGLNKETKKLSDSWYGFDQPSAMDYLIKHGYNPVEGIIQGKEYAEREQKAAFAKMSFAEQSEFFRLLEDKTPRGWSHSIEQDEADALVRHGRLHELTGVKWNEEEKRWAGKTPEDDMLLKAIDAARSHYCGLESEAKKLRKTDPARAKELKKEVARLKIEFEKLPVPHLDAAIVNKWSSGRGLGHDAINQWICVEVRARRLGVYGKCRRCKGKGVVWKSKSGKYLADKFKEIKPPEGEGWQVWETVSEGSPVSPAFATGEELIDWLSSEAAGREQCARESAEAFVKGSGWVPSMVAVPGVGLLKNYEIAATQKEPGK